MTIEPGDRMNVEPTPVSPTSGEPMPINPEIRTVDPTLAEPVDSSDYQVRVEEFKINGDSLVTRVRELIHQGNIRRVIIKNEEGHTLLEIPMTIGVVGGVVGAAAFPVLAALGVIGAMVAHLTLVIEKQA